jgi:hypothetical protein
MHAVPTTKQSNQWCLSRLPVGGYHRTGVKCLPRLPNGIRSPFHRGGAYFTGGKPRSLNREPRTHNFKLRTLNPSFLPAYYCRAFFSRSRSGNEAQNPAKSRAGSFPHRSRVGFSRDAGDRQGAGGDLSPLLGLLFARRFPVDSCGPQQDYPYEGSHHGVGDGYGQAHNKPFEYGVSPPVVGGITLEH